MRDLTVNPEHVADDVISNVREIVNQEAANRTKLSALRKLTARLGVAAVRCQRSYEKARQTGNAAAMATLKRQHDLIDRGMQYVSASAKKLVRRKPKQIGFDCEPNYFVDPGWDK